MPVQVRFYDTEGDGYWFRVEPVEKSETEAEAVVSLVHSEAEYTAVWLSADDVEKLIEELKQYTKKPEPKYNPSYIYPSIDVPGYKPQVWWGGTTTNNIYPDKNGD